MGIEVRRAESSDLDWLLEQLKAFSKFHGTKRSLFGSDEWSRSALTTMIENHVFLVAERDETELLGLIAGVVTPHFMNPEINLLCESFWWVSEEHRRSRAGLMLLEAFTKIGKEVADWVLFTLEHHSPVSDRCLTKRGYWLRERTYLLEVR